MADVAQLWPPVLQKVINNVTGVGVWSALRAAHPIAIEDGVLILGLDGKDQELSGHLRVPLTKKLIESNMTAAANQTITLRIIEGRSLDDWAMTKRRDAERRRLQEAEMTKLRAELDSKQSWESVYDQLSRRYAAVTNKSLPQNRARFFEEAIELIVQARSEQTNWDEMQERNFARCLERVAQYSEIPSVIVAMHVLQRAGEL